MDDLIDLGGYPEINAAGLADSYPLGDGRCRLLFFDWYKLDGVYRRRITGALVRPIRGLEDDNRKFFESLRGIGPADENNGRPMTFAH